MRAKIRQTIQIQVVKQIELIRTKSLKTIKKMVDSFLFNINDWILVFLLYWDNLLYHIILSAHEPCLIGLLFI